VSEEKGSWSERDRERIAAEGLTVDEVDRQLDTFRRGISPVRLKRPCMVEDGIALLSAAQAGEALCAYERARHVQKMVKFVPASGAASRMFKEWFQQFSQGGIADRDERKTFLQDLKKYPFFPDLQAAVQAKGLSVEELIGSGSDQVLLEFILTDHGLGYGRLPKALLKFHASAEGARTALEEHLVEAAMYARDAGNCSRIHLTVSPEHVQVIRKRLSEVIGAYEERCGTIFDIGLSTQETSTNTIAVDTACRPFRDGSGGLVFRPGGHGALLHNMDAIPAEIIFLKNIDNCVPDRLKPETVRWKKILAGYLLLIQERIFHYLSLLDRDDGGGADLAEIATFCRERLHIVLPADFEALSGAERNNLFFRKLNRPLRVCGMVRNAGEPGGGPFWVDMGAEAADAPLLQIVEEAQIDRQDPRQRKIWMSSTHFNPVDLVCGISDFRGRKFTLQEFVDPALSIISRKSEQERELLALERPGLWNGSMAFWNTLFVEVPLSTFNPVKVVTDLLRPQHLAT
jgi:hypothetical protein